MFLFFILGIVLVVTLIGSLPAWPHSKNWGYLPSGGAALILLVLAIILLLGHF